MGQRCFGQRHPSGLCRRVVPDAQFENWLEASDAKAHDMMTWAGMPDLVASAAPCVEPIKSSVSAKSLI